MARQFARLLLCIAFALGAPAAAAPVAVVNSGAETTPQSKFDVAVDAAKGAMMSQPGAALEQAQQARKIASGYKGEERELKLATAGWLEGEALVRVNRPEEAEPILDEALKAAAEVAPETKLHADLLKSNATIASLSGDIAKAMMLQQEAHAIYLKIGDGRSRAIVLQNIGSIYADANDHAQALRYYNLAQDAYSQDPMLALAASNNRGNSHKELGNYAEAEAAYQLALQSAATMQSPLLEARILTNIASAQYLQGQLDQAEATLQLGFDRATGEAADWRPFLWGVSAQIANARGDAARAKGLLEQTFAGHDLASTTLLFRDFHETAHSVYSNVGEFETALQHLAAQKRLDDESREAAASANFALMNAKFDAANQELRIAQSEQDLRSVKQLAVAGAIAGTFVIMAILFALFSAKQSRRRVDAANAQLTHAARHDALTQLINRAYSRELLGEAIEECADGENSCGILLVDLDRFKQVNDTHGHSGGDRLLELVSERLAEIADDRGVAARLGGDEFAIIMRKDAEEEAMHDIARKVVVALKKPFEIMGNSVMIGGSVGYAMSPEHGDCVDALVRNADLALYQAKRQGRSRAFGYEQWMAEAADQTGLLEQDLRKAISEGELSLVFQPIISASTGEVRAREALVRWHHPVRGTVEPSLFVTVAENAGLIEAIGSWVLREACRTARSWPENEKVAINVSVAQLKRGGFLDTVVNALAWSGLDPRRLELEITESVFLSDDIDPNSVLAAIRELGVTLSLDDFGTGYSSLSYLQRDVFSTLKIDRSFVARAAKGSEDSMAIVRAILDLAKNFKMETVAEGVETEAHGKLMRELGCTYLQGFLFGQPKEHSIASAEDIDQFDNERSADAA